MNRRLETPIRLGPGDHLDDSLLVLEREGRVPIALLAVLELDRVNHATDRDAVLMRSRGEVAGRGVGQPAEVAQELVEWMAGEKDADRLFLGAQQLLVRPFGDDGNRRWFGQHAPCATGAAEEAALVRVGLALDTLGPAHHVLGNGQ